MDLHQGGLHWYAGNALYIACMMYSLVLNFSEACWQYHSDGLQVLQLHLISMHLGPAGRSLLPALEINIEGCRPLLDARQQPPITPGYKSCTTRPWLQCVELRLRTGGLRCCRKLSQPWRAAEDSTGLLSPTFLLAGTSQLHR